MEITVENQSYELKMRHMKSGSGKGIYFILTPFEKTGANMRCYSIMQGFSVHIFECLRLSQKKVDKANELLKEKAEEIAKIFHQKGKEGKEEVYSILRGIAEKI